jgi:PAS domain S-box-containing protein
MATFPLRNVAAQPRQIKGAVPLLHPMPASRQRLSAPDGVPLAVAAALTLTLFFVTWVSGPVLRHMPQAVIPWPVHGIALAIILAARPKDRIGLALGILVAVALGAGLHSQDWPRSFAAGAQMTAQSIVITLLHQWLSRGRHPLRGVLSYAWLAVAVLFGILPTTMLVTIMRAIVGAQYIPGYTFALWWVAAVTSIAAITPILMAPTAPVHPEVRRVRGGAAEFAAVAALYVAALLSAFLAVGNEIFVLPPAVASIPFLVWAGLRFGVRGYAFFALLFCTAVITSTLLDIGPFSDFGRDSMVRGQRAWIYIASLAGPTMIFPIALAERAAAEARARSAFAQFAAIIESSGDLIAAVDRDLTVIAVNPAWVQEFESISGVRVHAGMPMSEAFAELPLDATDSLAHWRRAIDGERLTVTREVGDPDRARNEYEISYSPVRDERGDIVGASQVVRNVSHRRKQEAAAADARRLEALGRLAGGVAHDFNNLMTAVVGYTGIVAATLPPDDARQADLAEIEKAAKRAGELTQQLLAFARRRIIEPKLVDIGDLVTSFTRLLAPLLGSTVRLAVNVEAELPTVRLDPVQFEQVLMNLAVNARDAMPSGGDLTVDVAAAPYRDGNGVRLTVRDTGHGMSPETLARIWEPFYTTKPVGRGTGLGLATVHGIVHQAGGEISVESSEGVGTAFHVLLPAATTA